MKLTHSAVVDILTTVGPLTGREVAEFFPGTTAENVSAVISSLRNAAKPRVHISAWTRDNGHGKTYLRAVYAAGNGPEARKPKPLSVSARCARWRAKQRPAALPNSVFSWAAQL